MTIDAMKVDRVATGNNVFTFDSVTTKLI